MKSFVNNNLKMKMMVAFLAVSGLFGNSSLLAQITITKTDAHCGTKDGSATASVNHGTPPYSYQWSNGGSGPTISNLGPGTYTVSVTDANNCKGKKSVTIEGKKGSLDVSMSGGGEVPFCVQDGPPSITLSASVSGGTPPYTWSPAQSITISGSGKYSIGVMDSSRCFGKATAVFTYIPILCSRDPNEILGPQGYGEPRFVAVKNMMDYLINFENDPDFATAPAQKVLVSYEPDPHVNLSSVRLGDFGFGNFVFSVPANSSYYSNRLDVTDSLGVFVDVTAGINVGNNTAFWLFQSIDPATGLPPEDPLLGFLPINDSLSRHGEGFVSFSIRPKSTTQTGDSIKGAAAIVFDINPPLATNTWLNIADALPPQSSADPLPPAIDSTRVLITASGNDDAGGSGIASFDLYVSENGGSFTKYAGSPWGVPLLFEGNPCNTYSFYTIAIDNTGNREAGKTMAEATSVLSPAPQFSLQPLDDEVELGHDALFSLTATNAAFYQWEYSPDGGASFLPLPEMAPYSGTNTHSLVVNDVTPDLNGLRVRCLVSNGGCFSYSNLARLIVISSLSGNLTYDNSLSSPLSNTDIILYSLAMAAVDTATTNSNGSYLFSNIEPDIYIARPDVHKTWGGANATDALVILRHFTNLDTLEGLRRLAGDVNLSNNLNAIDALLIARRFVGAIPAYPSGDWLSPPDTIDLGSATRVLDFLTLCYGDVDASFIPALKMKPRVSQVEGLAVSITSGQEFELPLIVTRDLLAGAVSLVIEYPATYLELLDLQMKNAAMTQEMHYAVHDNVIRVAWYSLTPFNIEMGEPLFTFRFRAAYRPLDGNLAFTVKEGSEVAGKDALVYDHVELVIPKLLSTEQNGDSYLGQNYPNPFSHSTEISYFLTEKAQVELALFNSLGQRIKMLVDGWQDAGYHKVTLLGADLAPGIYPYSLSVSTTTDNKRFFHLLTIAH